MPGALLPELWRAATFRETSEAPSDRERMLVCGLGVYARQKTHTGPWRPKGNDK